MESNLIIALQITVVGMGLVFGAILLLWIVMAVLVNLTSDRRPIAKGEAATDTLREQKRKAAAIAVAVALASESDLEPHEFPLPPTAVVSPWQSVMRSNILNKRGRIR